MKVSFTVEETNLPAAKSLDDLVIFGVEMESGAQFIDLAKNQALNCDLVLPKDATSTKVRMIRILPAQNSRNIQNYLKIIGWWDKKDNIGSIKLKDYTYTIRLCYLSAF